jgi:hypothetical protein
MQGHLPAPGTKENALRLDKIPDVEHPVEEIQAFFADLVGAQEQLNSTRAIFDMHKGDLAHRAQRPDPPGQSGSNLPPLLFSRFEFSDRLRAQVGTLRARGIGVNAFGPQFFQLLQADLFK